MQDHADDQAQEKPQPVEEEAEVVSGGGEDGVDGVALLPSEIIAVHAVAVLDVTDDGLDGGATAHLTLDGRRHAALLARGEDLEPGRLRKLAAH